MALKVAITGPESCGKTTLTRFLAMHYKTAWLAEYSREYLALLNRAYLQSDLEVMASEQLARTNALSQMKNLVFLDTDLLSYVIWNNVKYNSENSMLTDLWLNNLPDFYLLCTPEIEWEFDPLRESKNERITIYKEFVRLIEKSDVPYSIVAGEGVQRNCNARFLVKQHLDI